VSAVVLLVPDEALTVTTVVRETVLRPTATVGGLATPRLAAGGEVQRVPAVGGGAEQRQTAGGAR
jgi:hypothetical protein